MKYPNILWITVDACRKDLFYNLPFIKQLSKKSIVFENAFANAPWTLPSVASMFTGLYPSQHGALNEKTKLRKNVKTIAEILKEKGYETVIITQNDGWITPFYGLTRGFKKIYDVEKLIEETLKLNFQKQKRLRRLIRAFAKYFIGYQTLTIKLLKSLIKDTREPWFIYLHLMDTHLPYEPRALPIIAIFRYLVFYKNWKEKMQMTWIGEKIFTKKEIDILTKLYDKAVQQVGKQIKRFMQLIDDNTVCIITADHGENLGEYGLVGHQFSFHDTLIKIPLIIVTPDRKHRIIKKFFENKDLFFVLQELIEKKTPKFFERDYVFGESYEIESVYQKLRNINPNIARGGKFIRITRAKYIKYMNGKEMLYLISDNEETEIKDETLMENLRTLMLLKETNINKRKLQHMKI